MKFLCFGKIKDNDSDHNIDLPLCYHLTNIITGWGSLSGVVVGQIDGKGGVKCCDCCDGRIEDYVFLLRMTMSTLELWWNIGALMIALIKEATTLGVNAVLTWGEGLNHHGYWRMDIRSGVDVSVNDSRFFVWRERGGEKRDVDCMSRPSNLLFFFEFFV